MAGPSKSVFGHIANLGRHSAIYAVSTAIQRLTGIVLLPVYTSFTYIQSRGEYGNYALVYVFLAFMNLFYLYGMDSALLRYFYLGNKDRKTVFSSTFLILLVTGVATTLLLFSGSDAIARVLLQDEKLGVLIRPAVWILLFDSLLNLSFLVLRAEEKSIQFTFFRAFRFLLELCLNIVFVVVLRKGVLGIIYANLIASLINFVAMLPIAMRYFRPRIDFALWKEMLRFGLPFLPNGIAYMTIEMVDRFLVQEYLGKDAVGLYSANYKFGTILLLLVVAFRNAWQPFFLKIAGEPRAREIFARVLTYFTIGAGLVTVTVSFFIRDLLTWRILGKFTLLGSRYWAGIPIIPLILLSYFCFGIYVILTPGFYIKKKSKYMVLFTGSGAIINIVLNLILLPRFYIWGAAWATLGSYLVMALGIYLVSNRIYPIPLQWSRLLKTGGLLGIYFSLYYLFELPFWGKILLILTLFLICYKMLLEADERQALKSRLSAIFT